MQTWQVQSAKARFSELIKTATEAGPQEITAHGKSVAVLLSRDTFDRLTGGEGPSLVDFIRASPLMDAEDLVIERDTSLTRELDW